MDTSFPPKHPAEPLRVWLKKSEREDYPRLLNCSLHLVEGTLLLIGVSQGKLSFHHLDDDLKVIRSQSP